MIEALTHFFYMDGYGSYVWTAYGSLVLFLLMGISGPLLRWHRYVRKIKSLSKNEPSS